MRDALSVLAERTVSAFPLSIGTSLAFESLFDGRQAPYDNERELPSRINIDDYKIFLINVGTLIRNIIGALPSGEAEYINAHGLIRTLTEEINLIKDILINEGENKLIPYFYVRNYKSIERSFHKALLVKFYKAKTEKQLVYYSQLENTYRLLKSMKEFDVNFVTTKLHKKVHSNALILTHYPYDLLSYDEFNKLDLLESHTGVLKTRKEFNTKYYDYKKLELENMPFQRKLLAIFGDHVLFKPYPLKIRQVFIDVARKSKWTPITSEYKVDNDINMYVADLGIKQEFRLI